MVVVATGSVRKRCQAAHPTAAPPRPISTINRYFQEAEKRIEPGTLEEQRSAGRVRTGWTFMVSRSAPRVNDCVSMPNAKISDAQCVQCQKFSIMLSYRQTR